MFESSSAWFLLVLLPVIPIAGWRLFSPRRQAGFRYSVASRVGTLEATWRQRSAWLPSAFRLLGLILLIVAVARPREGLTQRATDAEGIAIQLVLDCSGSMENDDFLLHGSQVTRLAAVQDVATRFIQGDEELPGRLSDLVGLVTFARSAQTTCPLTLNHEFVTGRLAQTEVVANFRKDGTAIGEGLALAVANLRELDRSAERSPHEQPVQKVAILLSDGENNAGEIDPEQAAELARMFDVRVYVIAVRPGATSRVGRLSGTAPENDSLSHIAVATGGKFYTAEDGESLRTIYAEIDDLERTLLVKKRYTDYREWAIEPFTAGPFVVPPLALLALMLLSLDVIGHSTLYLRIP